MVKPARVSLESRLEEYDKWLSAGAPYPAVRALGRAIHDAADEDRPRVFGVLKGRVELSALQQAAVEAASDWRRIVRILSIGTTFNDDELLLVLTLRQEIDLASDVLRLFGIDADNLNLATIDAEIREVASRRENRRAFASALATIQRNSDVPVVNLWSGD